MRAARWLAATVVLAAAMLALAPSHASAFVLYACHDDTSISRDPTHGSPLNGSFGDTGQVFNHSHGYYYLDVKSTSACPVGADGLYHFVLHITANGLGDAAGCTPQYTTWGPPCYNGSDGGADQRLITGTALAAETPAWGLETKDASTGASLECQGGDGSGGYPSECVNSSPVTASPGNATIEWRYDGTVSQIRQRIDDQYWDSTTGTLPIWETATLDVVPCSTCEPS
jgi:hypothetical protein